jgi:hypothetical protein
VGAVPLAGGRSAGGVEVALPVGGCVSRVIGAFVDALVGAAAELDRPAVAAIADVACPRLRADA